MQGWIKLHRKLLGSPIFQNEKLLKVFIYCLMKATHSDHEQIVGRQNVQLKPGQFVFGRKKAALELDIKESTIRDYMNVLKADNVITITPTNKFSVITVVNWGVYQDQDDDNRQQKDNRTTTERQQTNTNKNVKNVKNELFSSSSDQQFSEVMAFYQSNLQKGITDSPYNAELITQWFDEWGPDLLLAAMKVSAKVEAKGVNFTEGVLKNWKEAGVKSIEDARKYENEFKASKSKPYKNNVVSIPNYEKGGSYAGSNEQDSKESGNVRLFR